MPKLSKKFIEHHVQHPNRGQSFYADSELAGFWLRVTPCRVYYVVQWRINESLRSITIGDSESLSVEAARGEAAKILSALSQPLSADQAVNRNEAIALGRVFEKYTLVRPLRPNTVRLYRALMVRCLGDWQQLPVAAITKDMVEARHRELRHTTPSGSDGSGQANMTMRLLRALLNFAADHYEAADGQPILIANPVKRLSQNKSWYRVSPRQTIVPDSKLADWYKAVIGLRNRTMSDYLLFMLLTGLRRTEAATLRWSDVSFDQKLLVIRANVSKNHREHRLPLSEFVQRLLMRRCNARGKSEYVFQGRGEKGHIVGLKQVLKNVRTQSGCAFVIHDLRRTYLTMAERLDVPHYALKRLANHVSAGDVTAAYIVIDVERLRIHVNRIADKFLALLFPDINEIREN